MAHIPQQINDWSQRRRKTAAPPHLSRLPDQDEYVCQLLQLCM
jgi:hypothetical protein